MMPLVLPHDPAWEAAARSEACAIQGALGACAITLHHIGSTAVPGILAKPIIDLLGVVASVRTLNTLALEGLGYEAMGAYGIKGRRYFRKVNAKGRRTHHLHIFQDGAPPIERHLAFRDYLIAHKDVANAYSALKKRLTQEKSASNDRYMDGKDPFVRATERDALVWARRR